MSDMGWPADEADREAAADYVQAMTEHQEYVSYANIDDDDERWTAEVHAPNGHIVTLNSFGIDILETFVAAVASRPDGRIILNLDDGGRMLIRNVRGDQDPARDDPPESPTALGHYEQGEPW